MYNFYRFILVNLVYKKTDFKSFFTTGQNIINLFTT